jgi:hypothetical protein
LRFKKAKVGFRVLAGGGVKRGGGGDDGGVDRSSSSSSSCVISENMTELRRDGLDAVTVTAVTAMDDSRMAYRKLDSASSESSTASTRRFFEAWKLSSS